MKKKDNNTGENNTGNWNSGNRNSGDINSGDWNSGDYNSGNRNSGDWNSGNMNSGNRNSGNRNSGNWNSGYSNSGNRNSGDWNSGNSNSGYCNSGNWNSGDWNSGNSNSGYWNSGIFNTDEPFMRSFNKETNIRLSDFIVSNAYPDFSDMTPCVWVESSIMTDEEKKANPTHETTGGYLKVLTYKEAWAVWKQKCTPGNWKKVLALPNFDKSLFFDITGIEIDSDVNKEELSSEIELNGHRYKLIS